MRGKNQICLGKRATSANIPSWCINFLEEHPRRIWRVDAANFTFGGFPSIFPRKFANLGRRPFASISIFNKFFHPHHYRVTKIWNSQSILSNYWMKNWRRKIPRAVNFFVWRTCLLEVWDNLSSQERTSHIYLYPCLCSLFEEG